MSTPNILKETPMCMAEVKAEIDKIKKRDKELSFRTNRTDEYLQQFVNKDSVKLAEGLRKLKIPRLKDEHIAKIADLMPKSADDLKSVLQGYTVTITKDNMNKIVDEVKKVV
jgi:DNA-directed RNA polymerase subunit F